MGAFGWPHLLILLAVVLLLFGAAKLPALAKSVGQSARVFKGEIKAMKDEDKPADVTVNAVQAPPSAGAAAADSPGSVTSTSDTKP